jgi:hypothetical protein
MRTQRRGRQSVVARQVFTSPTDYFVEFTQICAVNWRHAVNARGIDFGEVFSAVHTEGRRSAALPDPMLANREEL